MQSHNHLLTKSKKLIIFGLEDFADIAYEYFTYDSDYEVVAFTADSSYIKEPSKFNLPVIDFETIEKAYRPEDYYFFSAIVYSNLNKTRRDICHKAKQKGYKLASYISSRAFVWRNIQIGEHCFVFENNTIQPFVSIGDNTILWSGNHIGHHSKIGNHCFVTSHVVVSGWSVIEDYCFIGVNTTLANNTSIGSNSWVSHGTSLNGRIPANSLIKANSSAIAPLNEAVLFRTLAKASRARK